MLFLLIFLFELGVFAGIGPDNERVFLFDRLHIESVLMHQQILIMSSVCVCVAVDALFEHVEAFDHFVAAKRIRSLRV